MCDFEKRKPRKAFLPFSVILSPCISPLSDNNALFRILPYQSVGKPSGVFLIFADPATFGDLHGGAKDQTFFDVDDPLVAAAPEGGLQGLL